MMIAFVLSLLLHGVVILALFDTERPPADAGSATFVSVHLVPSQPAEAPTPPPSPPHAASVAPSSGLDEVHKQGNEPPRVGMQSAPISAAPAQTPSSPTPTNSRTRVATWPTPKTQTSSNLPRFAEAPDNRADDSPSTYLRLLAMRLAEVKQYPSAAIARHEQGQALLSFRLDRNGRVLSWEIARSSGHDELDAEVARMVDRAAPFPPFPANWRATSASFQVPIGFSLY